MKKLDRFYRQDFEAKNPLRISSLNHYQSENLKKPQRSEKYKDWVMPPERERYLKHRVHDPL